MRSPFRIARARLAVPARRGARYTVTGNSRLEFQVRSGERVLAEVRDPSVHWWMRLGWPYKLEVVLDGRPEGLILRAFWNPFRGDRLVLHGKEHTLPAEGGQHVGKLPMRVSWGRLSMRASMNMMPSICLYRESDFLAGLVILPYLYLRRIVTAD